jgi:site-specific DNA-adenine methylase
MEYLGIIIASSLGTALVFICIYAYMQYKELNDKVDIQDNFLRNLRKDVENLYLQLERTEDAFQNDIRRHIEDLREDFNHKADDLSNKNMFDYLNQASSFFNSFVDKSVSSKPNKGRSNRNSEED